MAERNLRMKSEKGGGDGGDSGKREDLTRSDLGESELISLSIMPHDLGIQHSRTQYSPVLSRVSAFSYRSPYNFPRHEERQWDGRTVVEWEPIPQIPLNLFGLRGWSQNFNLHYARSSTRHLLLVFPVLINSPGDTPPTPGMRPFTTGTENRVNLEKWRLDVSLDLLMTFTTQRSHISLTFTWTHPPKFSWWEKGTELFRWDPLHST